MKLGISDQIRKQKVHKNVVDEAKEKLHKSDQKRKNFDEESKDKLHISAKKRGRLVGLFPCYIKKIQKSYYYKVNINI